ncbi:MAG: hypothetical protein GX131_09700, partial [candidate division WS1 bacterium]|nr:hypothetical protein [candidate division WS1 bacterium]
LILLTTTILPAEDATLLHACDALEGASISTGGNWPDTQLVVSDDPSFITEGSGSLRLSGTSPADATGNSYLSIDLVIPPSDFTGKVLRFDAGTSTPDQSEALYVRGYNSAGECALSWFSWSGLLSDQMQTFELYPAMARKGLTWEPEMVKTEAPIDVVKLRIYTGTHNPGAAFDLFVDNVRVEASTMRSFLDITEPKPLFPETVLVEAGEPQAVIITPEGDEWAAVAAEVAGAIEAATGAKLQVVTPNGMDEAAIAETNAIIIGSIVNNMALLYPYSHQLTFADGVYPGAGGYELRTVHDPWGTGRNILAIGGSDVAGARAALEALAPHLQPGETLVLPPLLEAKLTGLAEETWGSWFTADLDERWAEGVRRSCETHLERAGTRGLFSMAEGQGLRYALTGREEYARMYVWMIKRTYEWYLSSPGTYGGPWGMDSDFHISRNIPAWDNVEECPAVTDEERWEVTKILFRWVSELGPQKSARAGSTSVRFNHQTFPALGCLYAGQYFQRYYDTFEGEYWVEVADGTFQYQLNASKPHCDCNTYQWHTLNHTLTYCMARPDLSYFTSGNARLNAEYGIMMMNNLGYQVPNGDIGGWGPIGAELRILRMAEWFYREGLYQWALDRKAQIRPQPELSSFSMPPDHPAVEPAHLLGAQGWALDELWYNSFGGPDEVALESAIDKISFRESFDPDAGYLLLDGLTRGGHGHMDANAILQWTENGRVWLADVDYIKSLPKYHNSMLVLRDGQSAPLPGYCELQNLADFETVGASQTVLRNYAGVDWHRGVIQLKNRGFVVVDRLVAREPGDYSFRAVWRTLGNTELDGATWQVEQDGQHAAIVMTADTRCIVTPDEYTSKNWSSYPWVDDALVLSMQGIVDARLEPGEQVTMFTVLHASGEEPSPVQVRRLSREMIAITGLGDPVIVAAGDRDGRIVLPGAATMVGELVTMTPTHICAVGVTQAEALGQSETREGGADAEANIAAGTVQVRSPMAATVGATQTVEVMDLPMQATSAEVAGLMNMIIAAAS